MIRGGNTDAAIGDSPPTEATVNFDADEKKAATVNFVADENKAEPQSSSSSSGNIGNK